MSHHIKAILNSNTFQYHHNLYTPALPFTIHSIPLITSSACRFISVVVLENLPPSCNRRHSWIMTSYNTDVYQEKQGYYPRDAGGKDSGDGILAKDEVGIYVIIYCIEMRENHTTLVFRRDDVHMLQRLTWKCPCVLLGMSWFLPKCIYIKIKAQHYSVNARWGIRPS